MKVANYNWFQKSFRAVIKFLHLQMQWGSDDLLIQNNNNNNNNS